MSTVRPKPVQPRRTHSYPVFVAIEGRACLVVGGGPEAARKVRGLLAAGARPRVISPDLTVELRSLHDAGRFEWWPRRYEPGDMAGFQFLFVATNDRAANQKMYDEAGRLGIMVNATDDPGRCDFIVPAVLRADGITVAVSTSNSSPALARRIREELTDYFTPGIAANCGPITELKADLAKHPVPVDEAAWHDAVDDRKVRVLVAQRRFSEARARVIERIGATPRYQAQLQALDLPKELPR